MRVLTIGGKEYKIEYSFEAAEYKSCVDKAFKLASGSYLLKNAASDKNAEDGKANMVVSMLDGTADMVSDMPSTVVTFLYAGLLENNPVESEKDAKKLFKQFVMENPDDDRASFMGMYEYLKEVMEEDHFFKLTGMEKMLNQMAESAKKAAEEAKKAAEEPEKSTSDQMKGHEKKSTSTK